MHGTVQVVAKTSPQEAKVVDPVCGMTIDPATAAASEIFNGRPMFFCSESCRRQFLADPAAHVADRPLPAVEHGGQPTRLPASGAQHHVSPGVLTRAVSAGVLATAAILGFYFGALTLVSGWLFTVEQFLDWWPYILALSVGFGSQVGLFVYLRRALHGPASGKVVAATGTTSGAAMVACCSHYLANLLPVLGATGLVTFVGTYQVELFWFGILSNLAGLVYIGRRVVSFAHANTQGAGT